MYLKKIQHVAFLCTLFNCYKWPWQQYFTLFLDKFSTNWFKDGAAAFNTRLSKGRIHFYYSPTKVHLVIKLSWWLHQNPKHKKHKKRLHSAVISFLNPYSIIARWSSRAGECASAAQAVSYGTAHFCLVRQEHRKSPGPHALEHSGARSKTIHCWTENVTLT